MTRETKKHRHKKSHITRKVRETHPLKALPPYPHVPPVQKSRKPGQNFYLFVNSAWLQHVKTPTYRSAFGVSEELEESIKENLLVLLEKSTTFAKTGKQSRGIYEKSFQLVGQFGLSALRPSVQSRSIHLLKKMITDIYCLRDTVDLTRILALFVKMRITSLLTFYTYYEPGPKIRARCALSPGQLGLPDPSYYFPNEAEQAHTLEMYGAMLDKIAKLLDLDIKLSNVIPIEHLFAKEFKKSQYQTEIYLKGNELQEKYSKLNWKVFWDVIGYTEWKQNTLKLNPPGFIKSVDRFFSTLPIENWKLLLTTHLILHAIPVLPPPFDDIHSEFYEKHLRGQARKLPQKELTIRLLQEWMPTTVSKLYLKYFIEKNLKQEATAFVKTIQTAAINRIGKTDWFTEKTRQKAIEKVRKMKMGIAYPSSIHPLTGISIQTDNLLQNILILGTDHTDQELKKANKIVDVQNEWDDAIYAVNAYYYSEINQLILPSGSLQWPFYHPSAPFGWNYGGIGAVIGHEMTHAFDSDGKDYDWEGKKEKWWTLQDNREYNKRTKALIHLFNNAEVMGHQVNGSLTLNENISDLGGLAIALDALNLECKKRKLSDEDKKEAYRNFFISYAVSWRIKEKPEKVLQGLFMDRHAPAPLRVNLVVNQFDEWYEAFDVQVKDELYIPAEERIRIF